MKTFRDFYIFSSASISSSYIFHSSFNHISANFEKKRDELISSRFMRKDYFFSESCIQLAFFAQMGGGRVIETPPISMLLHYFSPEVLLTKLGNTHF